MAEFQFDRRLVERLAVVYEGSAEMHFEHAQSERKDDQVHGQRWSQREMLAASDLVIAASYWSLIDAHRAVRLYRRASELYRAIGHSYWMVLALASGTRSEIRGMTATEEEVPASNSQAIAFAMVANEMSDDRMRGARAEHLNSSWRHAGNVPVGRLGIPLDHYGRCAQAMRLARTEKNVERFIHDGASYVHRAEEVLRTASHDRFHWSQLRSSILPAEPEAVAMTTAMAMMSHDVFGMPISEMPNLDSHGRLLVAIGDQMRDAAEGDQERRQ